jgi:hypothetical protein
LNKGRQVTASKTQDHLAGQAARSASRRPPAILAFRRRIAFSFFLALVMAGSVGARAQSGSANEYDVKAAFLFNFAKFIEWPNSSPQLSKSPFVICVYGDDPFGSSLDAIVKGKTINDREIVTRRVHKTEELRECQMVFISSSEESKMPAVLAALNGSSVVLIGETPGFAQQGGHIQLVMEDNRVRFLVNVDAAKRSHLQISSKLLSLAEIVHEERDPGKN